MTAATELVGLDAADLARMIAAREVSALEVMDAHIARIERVNPAVNAIVTFDPEGARAGARAADAALARGAARGVLFGLPTAVKDLVPTAGMRTTMGSPVYRDHVPAVDALIVTRMKAAGAIVLGKTNTPEFGAGSQTFNAVFGATRNPYDLARTCGGSSGGAAVAVACGFVPVADGSDLAASLRNPASFCNVVGFRPTPGRVPNWPGTNAWDTLATLGPMARTVRDAALMMAAIAGPDARVPTSWPEAGEAFLAPLERSFRGVRVAWSPTLGGLPVERAVTAALEPARRTLADLGCVVEDADPDFSGAAEVFHALRAHRFAQSHATLLDTHRGELKATVVWNIEAGLRLSALDVARAEARRTEIFERLVRFFERYAFLACPVSQTVPFPVEVEYPTEIEGERFTNYIDWMKSCYYVSVIAHPAVSVPAAFTPDGLPVGLQLVGRYRDDMGVLALAHAFEQATRAGSRRPPATLA
ncbi:MAG: amidase [Burkholderiales bacterium]|nr:amidase [Burkholderiales bacterium]